MFTSYFITLLYWDPFFSVEGEAEKDEKELEVVFSVLNHNPFNPPKLKAEGATIFRNTREVNTYRQVGNNFHTILSKPTNQPTPPQLSAALYCRRDQDSLYCVYSLPQCCHLLRSAVYSLSAFSAALLLLFKHLPLKSHYPILFQVFLLSWQTQVPGLHKLNPALLNWKSDFRAINTDSIWQSYKYWQYT